MKKWTLFFAMLPGLFVMGCSGGGNSDGTPSGGNNNGQILGFRCSGLGTQLQVTGGGTLFGPPLADPYGKISLTFNRSGEEVVVAVVMDSPSLPVFGYGFYVAYDPAVVQFITYEPGAFLVNANLQTKIQMTSLGASKDIFGDCGTSLDTVILGHATSGYAASGVSGNGTLGILHFRMATPGKAKFLFRNFKMYSRAGSEEPAERLLSYPEAMIEFSG